MSAPIRYIADGQAVSVWHGITALIEAWEAQHGAPRLNRHGRPHGGVHPALLAAHALHGDA